MNKQHQLTGAGPRDKRRELDFYPTPPDATISLMEFLKLPKSIIWEPASGIGSMSKVIEGYGHKVISSDIRTENIYGEPGIDFLTTHYDVDAIITNPPFFLAEKFIRKSVREANTVAMLLKSQYWHALSRQELFKDHPPAYVLPLSWRPDFLFHTRKIGDKKGTPTMEVCWSVWNEDFHDTGKTIYHPLIKITNKL